MSWIPSSGDWIISGLWYLKGECRRPFPASSVYELLKASAHLRVHLLGIESPNIPRCAEVR